MEYAPEAIVILRRQVSFGVSGFGDTHPTARKYSSRAQRFRHKSPPETYATGDYRHRRLTSLEAFIS
ncbi:hypothetical protein [Desulfosporosinus metallidurans]|uniref:hypothetical protein n=1 Tax=Desulfosporosinus metallidurans TaxID=1888891 RepID=UPI00111537EB|nr:hypothetical protein [Desulfosporosinus metallidurans]